MLYKIDNKFYIQVQGYYLEVDIIIDGDNFDVKPNGNKLEVNDVSEYEVYDVRIRKDDIINEFKETNKIKVFESSSSLNKNKRM